MGRIFGEGARGHRRLAASDIPGAASPLACPPVPRYNPVHHLCATGPDELLEGLWGAWKWGVSVRRRSEASVGAYRKWGLRFFPARSPCSSGAAGGRLGQPGTFPHLSTATSSPSPFVHSAHANRPRCNPPCLPGHPLASLPTCYCLLYCLKLPVPAPKPLAPAPPTPITLH